MSSLGLRSAAPALAGLAAILSLACGSKRASAPPPPPAVKSAVVAPAADAPLLLRGTIAADSRLRLGFKTGGILAAVLVKEGDRVAKGQVLARLDPAEAQAQLRAAAAQRDKAKRDWIRADRLATEGALAASARDDARTALEAAEAGLAVAQEAVARMTLSSPATGTVFQRVAEPGESIQAGNPVLLVDETGSLTVKVGVTDRDLRRLRPGQGALLVPEDGSAPVKGRVASLAPTPNPADGLYAVEVKPEGAPKGWQPGVLIGVRFDGAAADPSIRVPLEALVHRQDRDWVFQVAEGRARLVPVVLGRTEGREIVVREGLKGGERVVTEGAYFLQDGQAVRVVDGAAAAQNR
ncbi:MAG: efflux RND transporter periplasmic adaptor subunit [Holophagaceae bacterium]